MRVHSEFKTEKLGPLEMLFLKYTPKMRTPNGGSRLNCTVVLMQSQQYNEFLNMLLFYFPHQISADLSKTDIEKLLDIKHKFTCYLSGTKNPCEIPPYEFHSVKHPALKLRACQDEGEETNLRVHNLCILDDLNVFLRNVGDLKQK